MPGPGNVAVHAGISTRHLVSALRNFTTACREAVREHANDLRAELAWLGSLSPA
ncbi:MAG: hypothetical protein IPK34_17170 [Ramlibacter sp.]|nr:hypothetical protein [Ramlibacter sp.]